jgi:predicted amidohydrolase
VIKASTIQFKPEYSKPDINRRSILELCNAAAGEESRLIILPEMCTTGYIWPQKSDLLPFSEDPCGETFRMFSEFCSDNSCFLAYGFPELDRGHIYNSQNLVSDNGELLATYRKVNLFDTDLTWADPGDKGYLSLDTSLGKIGLGICMDLNFDNFINFHIKSNTEWLLISTNWLEQYIDVQKYWKKRIKGYKGTVFISNRYGFEYGIEFCGQSSVISHNEFVITASRTGNSIITTTH